MRWSLLLVAALVAIGVAASVDALRGGGELEPQGPGARETITEATTVVAPSPAEALSAAGVSGTLYFSLPVEDGCILHTLTLPGLDDAGAFLLDTCEFDVSPRGDLVTGDPCPGNVVEVRPARGAAQRLRGCAPAWKPDGELTFVRDRNVQTVEGEILVRNVARAGRPWFSARRQVTVRAMAWLTNTRVAVVLAGRRRFAGDVMIVFEGEKALPGGDVAPGATIYVDRSLQQIWVAHPGDEFAAPGVTTHTRSGAFLRTAPFRTNVNGFAAAGDRWFALARPDNVCIYERRDPPPREEFPLTCLPFDVVDLAWT